MDDIIVDKIFDELKRELDEKQDQINSEYSNITMTSSFGDAGYYDYEDVIDSIGKIGEDPGDAWISNNVSTPVPFNAEIGT